MPMDANERIAELGLTLVEMRVLLHSCVGGEWIDTSLYNASAAFNRLVARGVVRRRQDGPLYAWRVAEEYAALVPAIKELVPAMEAAAGTTHQRYHGRRPPAGKVF